MKIPFVKYDRIKGVFGDFDFRQKVGIEFGSLSRPFLAELKNVRIYNIDHATTEELKKKYDRHARIKIEDIINVDFVNDGRPLKQVLDGLPPLDFAVAVHVGEHIPDFLGWLHDIATVLSPQGIVGLILPDKRRCFDAGRPTSTTGDIVGAFLEKRKQPPPSVVFNATVETYRHQNRPAWPALLPLESLDRRGDVHVAFKKAKIAVSRYQDVHCWTFTARSFTRIMKDLSDLEILPYKIRKIELPPIALASFSVCLERCDDLQEIRRSIEQALVIAEKDKMPG